MAANNSTCLCSELVGVVYEDRFGRIYETTGNLEEISRETATLLADSGTQRGRSISFIAQGHKLNGVVESCVWEPPLGYFIEVRLDESCRWSEEWWAPEHMLNLPECSERANAA